MRAYHITRISRLNVSSAHCDYFGHPVASHCDATGCAADERYLGCRPAALGKVGDIMDLDDQDRTVQVLIIHHKNGDDVSVHRSQDGASKALARHCREHWSELYDDLAGPPPTDDEECISAYFIVSGHNDIDGETWEIIDAPLED